MIIEKKTHTNVIHYMGVISDIAWKTTINKYDYIW